jgi:hypothetical protein
MQSRSYGKSVEMKPRLKEMLAPPPVPATLKGPKRPLPKLESIRIPQRIERSPTDILKVRRRWVFGWSNN